MRKVYKIASNEQHVVSQQTKYWLFFPAQKKVSFYFILYRNQMKIVILKLPHISERCTSSTVVDISGAKKKVPDEYVKKVYMH